MLHEILQDQVHGCHTVAKIVTGVVLPADDKSEYIEACKRVLSTMRVSSSLAYRKLLEVCGLPITSGPPGGGGNSRYQGPGANANGRSPNAPPRSGSAYPSGLGRGGYRSQHSSGPGSGPGPSHAHGYHPEPAYPSAQEMAMNSMMNSMQAFQLGQGMANQGGLSPIVIPGPGQGLGAGHGQGQSFGQMIQGHGGLSPAPMSPTPTLGSFATPHASMMSPNSDPFNPVSLGPVSMRLAQRRLTLSCRTLVCLALPAPAQQCDPLWQSGARRGAAVPAVAVVWWARDAAGRRAWQCAGILSVCGECRQAESRPSVSR